MEKLYETERLILKTLNGSYAGMVADYYLRNKAFLAQWISLREDAFYTRELQEKQLEKELIDIENNSSLRLWIFDKKLQDNIMSAIHLDCRQEGGTVEKILSGNKTFRVRKVGRE